VIRLSYLTEHNGNRFFSTTSYVKRVVDVDDPEQLSKVDQIMNIPDAAPVADWESIETNDEMRQHFRSARPLIITDDNMGLTTTWAWIAAEQW
jgi:hypothetical protein